MTCSTEIVRAYGVTPTATNEIRDEAYALRLRLRGFRGHCLTCGWLGPIDKWENARRHARQHRNNDRPAAASVQGTRATGQRR